MTTTPHITLKTRHHRGEARILVIFEYRKDLISIIKSLPEARWSATLQCWYVPHTTEMKNRLKHLFDGLANINIAMLSESVKRPSKKTARLDNRKLSLAQRHLLNQFVLYLRGKRYSKSTVSTYASLVADFISFIGDKPVTYITKRDAERFAEHHLAPKNYAISTHRQFISALKHFITFCPDTQMESVDLERPKRSKILPTVLSPEEIIDLLRCTKNLKHRAILGLLYSAGLRISELLNLELQHIDLDRRQLFIKNSKGRKDRYVVLSEGYLPLLSNYLLSYSPQRYFVEGTQGKYSGSSIRKFLKRSCKAANISKRVTPHTLRHSYATHLLEQGVGLRHIQELLGHVKPETTMIYTHVAKKDLLDIKSPLDRILLSLAKTQTREQHVLLSGNIKR